LKSWTFTTKVLIAVVAIIISLILFIVGFLLVLMSGLHKIKFCYSLFAISCSWHISAFTTGLPHFFNAPFVDISRTQTHASLCWKKYLHSLIFVLIIALKRHKSTQSWLYIITVLISIFKVACIITICALCSTKLQYVNHFCAGFVFAVSCFIFFILQMGTFPAFDFHRASCGLDVVPKFRLNKWRHYSDGILLGT
jgi:hypothetical protein